MMILKIFKLTFYKNIKCKQRNWFILFCKKQLNEMDILKEQKYCKKSQ